MTRSAVAAKKGGSGLTRYAGDIIGELKKVVWLSRRELAYLTALVLVVALVFGLLLGVLDYSFAALVDQIFLGR